MAHFRKMFDERFIGAWDMEGKKDVTVTIKSVKREELQANAGADASHKPVLYFEKTDKGMVCNKTNAKAIAAAYGPDVDDWIGKKITIHTERISAFGEMHDALRVRAVDTGRGSFRGDGAAPIARTQPRPVPSEPATPEPTGPAAGSDEIEVEIMACSSKATKTGGKKYSFKGKDDLWYYTFDAKIADAIDKGSMYFIAYTEDQYGRQISKADRLAGE